jgi:hypothetical protein
MPRFRDRRQLLPSAQQIVDWDTQSPQTFITNVPPFFILSEIAESPTSSKTLINCAKTRFEVSIFLL